MNGTVDLGDYGLVDGAHCEVINQGGIFEDPRAPPTSHHLLTVVCTERTTLAAGAH